MSDRHIRRLGDDYGTEFLTYLPQGQAWPREPGTILDLACRGLVDYYGFVDGRAADLLEIESDPRATMELLTDWERNWGLPDPCYAAPQGISARHNALIRQMTLLGTQSRQFYINFAAFIGYAITISEFRPFMIGMDRCGDSRVYADGSNPMFHPNFVRGYLIVCDPLGNRIGISPGFLALNKVSAHNVTLDTALLKATNTATTSADQGVQGGAPADISPAKSSGRYYFEVTFSILASTTTSNYGCGVAVPGAAYTSYGPNGTGGALVKTNGHIFSDGTDSSYTLGTLVAGTAIGIAVDLDSRYAWFKIVSGTPGPWNGSTANGDPAAGVNGVTIPVGTTVPTLTFGGTGGVANDAQTANFGPSGFLGTVPVGFTSGWSMQVGELSEWPNYGIGPPENRFYWTVHVGAKSLIWFRCGGNGGECGVDPHLRIGVQTELECVLARWKPAHTKIIYDYSGLAPSNPYAGTGGDLEGTSAAGQAAGISTATGISALVSVGLASGFGTAAGLTTYGKAAGVGAAYGISPISVGFASGFGVAVGLSISSPYASFDPYSATNSLTLSNSNLTATNTSNNGCVFVYGSSAKSTGKFYFEIALDTAGGYVFGGEFGVALTTATAGDVGGGTNSAVAFQNGQLTSNGTNYYSLGNRVQGDVIGVAVDLTNRKIWFRTVSGTPGPWNGATANGDPATALNGIPLQAGSMLPAVGFGLNHDVYTANFGASTFIGVVPSGFTAGWPS